jgi:ribonuclease P/MRP protein subunit RPP40
MEEWTLVLDRKLDIEVAYMDFQKAFDKVPHRRLLHKLHQYGIQNPLLRWLECYLSRRQQSVVVNGCNSSNYEVCSGISQGSVLGPALFIIYINDLPNEIASQMYLFADDTKLFRPIATTNDHQIFQNDVTQVSSWTDTWLLPLNEDKCATMHIGRHHPVQDIYLPGRNHPMKTSNSEKDLGIIFENTATFRQHINTQATKANRLMGSIRRSFNNLNENNFLLLYKTLIRPILEYGAPVWNPHLKIEIKTLESVQRRATRLIPGMQQLTYKERLTKLDLPTLAFRRWRGDLIETYKIFHYYTANPQNFFQLADSNTRGHSLKLAKKYSRTDIRKFTYSNRIVETWNSLPDHVVQATSVNMFKNRLDKFLKNHPAKYNHETEIRVHL